jgi:LemA protein
MSTKNITLISIIAFILLLGGCGCSSYNGMNKLKQETNSAWANVESRYKERADKIPNLVATVKGMGNYESETLENVIAARSRATQMTIDPNNLTPEKIKEYQELQGQIGAAMSRLLAIQENYPNLKAPEGFLNLQREISEIESKISVERIRFNEVAKNYNTKVTNFPNVLYAGLLGFKERGYFQATEQEKTTPKVDFSK